MHLPITQIEARVGRQELVSGGEAAHELVEGDPDRAKSKKQPVYKRIKRVADRALVRRSNCNQSPRYVASEFLGTRTRKQPAHQSNGSKISFAWWFCV